MAGNEDAQCLKLAFNICPTVKVHSLTNAVLGGFWIGFVWYCKQQTYRKSPAEGCEDESPGAAALQGKAMRPILSMIL